jgi:hypothetical protein
MNHTQVTGSSNVESIGFDPETKVLEVKFKDPSGTYRYEGVTPEKYQALMAAPSKGKHIHANIKGSHKHSKVPS